MAQQAALPPLGLGPLVHPPRTYTPSQHQALLEQAVTVAHWLVADLTPHLAALEAPARQRIEPLLDALPKVIADETTTEGDGRVRERPRDDKGHYRIMSAVDLEATFRKHEPDPAVLGSNAVVATTTTRIRAAVVATGSTPDQDAPVAVLRQHLAAQHPLPPALIMDQAGGMGKTRAQVHTASNGQTQMVAQVPHTGVAGPSPYRAEKVYAGMKAPVTDLHRAVAWAIFLARHVPCNVKPHDLLPARARFVTAPRSHLGARSG